MESDLQPAIGGYEEGGVIDIAKVEEEVLVGGSLQDGVCVSGSAAVVGKVGKMGASLFYYLRE